MSQRGQSLLGHSLKPERLSSFWTSRWALLLASGLVVVAVLAAYHNSFAVPFLLDDGLAITENATIRQLWPIGRVLSPPAGGLTVSGRPVVNLSLAVNYALGGTTVWGYHAFNLGVHILASLTLLGIVRRTLWQPRLRERFGAGALPLGLAVALLWGLHPLQTESVTYVVQRAESLMGLFYLLTVYGFIRGTESPGRGWYVVSVMACVLGMGSKEVMVTAPLMVWLYDRTFMAGTFRGALRARWGVYWGLGSSWLLLAWLVIHTGELGSERAGMQTVVSWGSYGLTQLWAVVHYLRLSVWPNPLVFDYGTILVTGAKQVVPAVLVVGVLVVGVVVSLVRWPAVGFLGCWFFAILAPTTSVLPLTGQTVAEHRMYLSLAAVVVVFVLGICTWFGRRSLVLFLALAVVSGWLTSRRNRDYHSELAIWSDTVAKHADNGRAQNNLGVALFQLGRVPESFGHFEQAVRLRPEEAEVRNNYGSALFKLNRVPEAIEQYQAALQLKPEDAEAHYNLGKALFQMGKLPEGVACLEQALRLKPDFANADYNLGVALFQLGRVAESIGHYKQALQFQPGYAAAANDLAWILATETNQAIRNVGEAVRWAERACEWTTNQEAGSLETLGVAYSEAGRFKEAVEATERAVACALAAGDKEAATRSEGRLVHYRAGRPYHAMGEVAKP